MRGANITNTKRARRLRLNATNAELKLWNRLRSRSINNSKFVRQEPIGPYIVDFVCREQRLVVEVDGGQHATSNRDAVRDRWLSEHNYRVLRFWNNDALTNIEGVLEVIAAALDAGNALSVTSPRLRGEVGEHRAQRRCEPGEGESPTS